MQDLESKLDNARFNMDQLMVSREGFIARLATSLEAPRGDNCRRGRCVKQLIETRMAVSRIDEAGLNVNQ